MKRKINILISAVLILLILPVQFGCNKNNLQPMQTEEQAIADEQGSDEDYTKDDSPDKVWDCTYNNMGSFKTGDVLDYWKDLDIDDWYDLEAMLVKFSKKHDVIDIMTYYDWDPSYTERYPTARELAQQTIKENIQYQDAYTLYAEQIHPDFINSEVGLAGIKIDAGAGLSSVGKVYFELINNTMDYVNLICKIAGTDWEDPVTLTYRLPFNIEMIDGKTQEVDYTEVKVETTMEWMAYVHDNYTSGNLENIWNKAAPIAGIYGDANEDFVINMQDVTYTKLIILEYRDRTEWSDAKYDDKINMQDVTQIELIILNKMKELWVNVRDFSGDDFGAKCIGGNFYGNALVETNTVQEDFRFATDLLDGKYSPDIILWQDE